MHHLVLAPLLLLAATPSLGAPAKPKPPKGSPEEMICKREDVTGSLVRARKTCATRAMGGAERRLATRGAGAGQPWSRQLLRRVNARLLSDGEL